MIEYELYFEGIALFVTLSIVVLFIRYWLNVIVPFNREKMYIKSEILRTTGKEKEYWKKELKILYISTVPVLGKFLIRFVK